VLVELVGRTPDNFELLQGSVKLRVLMKMLRRLRREQHRVLVFSQSRSMLDIIRHLIDTELDEDVFVIDGSVVGRNRQGIIDEFNAGSATGDDGTPGICLLSTKACGTGITLTGADRVIIYDPSWNPAEDRQAVDRAYQVL
jgi:SNF2 family DNA or RNA helicase